MREIRSNRKARGHRRENVMKYNKVCIPVGVAKKQRGIEEIEMKDNTKYELR